jgi:CheY-like chemotaxis protein
MCNAMTGMRDMTEKKKKILIIDDEKDLTFLMSEALSLAGDCEIYVANDGLEGQDLIIKKRPDIIFLDFVMPKVKGDEVLKFIHDNLGFKNVKVVIMSGLGNEVYFQESDRSESVVKKIKTEQEKKIFGDPSLEAFSPDVVEKYGIEYSLPKPFCQDTLLCLVRKILDEWS